MNKARIILLLICATIFFSCKTVKMANAAVADPQKNNNAIPFYPLKNDSDLDILMKEIGDARVVLLGESTHGTHEFYQWRAAISKRLIEEKGFNFIAVEGDWTDSYKVNQFTGGPLQDSSAAIELMKQYKRWPASMWGNYEMASFVQWVNADNQRKNNKTGFYGLDVYDFWKWANEKNISSSWPSLQQPLKEFQQAFSFYNNDALKYSSAVRKQGVNNSLVARKLFNAVMAVTGDSIPLDEKTFVLQQQARLALHGENYFREMVTDKVRSWNDRDDHMAETIKRLLGFYGKNSKAIIWVHNSHAGDVQYSQMAEAGYTSVGGKLEKEFGKENVFRIGFGTNKGSVMAGYKWNEPVRELLIPPAKDNSWENILHRLSPANKIVLSKDISSNQQLNNWVEFRSIGAAYSDAVYGVAIVPKRFDAFVYVDSTTSVHPIIF